MRQAVFAVALCVLSSSAAAADEPANEPPAGLVRQEFLYETAPFPECHASTLVETSDGLLVAWFGGTEEKHPDVGIWISRYTPDAGWSPVQEVANGVESPTKRYPCWNPVLHRDPGGTIVLFYKVGPSPQDWWGMQIESKDDGNTWSQPVRLPDGILGPIKNKGVRLADGTLLCPSSTEHDGWRVHMERTTDLGRTWSKTEALNDGKEFGAIQPTILQFGDKLQILCRSKGPRKILAAWSEDDGHSWSSLEPIDLPNPNSGIDAVTLKDGRGVMVYNHTERGRSPLNVAVTEDGRTWQAAVVLEAEPGEYSYPAVIQTSDGLIHATYTWKRQRIRHAVIDPSRWELRAMPNGEWPE